MEAVSSITLKDPPTSGGSVHPSNFVNNTERSTHIWKHCSSQQTQIICMPFVQRQPDVFDVGPTLYKCKLRNKKQIKKYRSTVVNIRCSANIVLILVLEVLN